MAAPAGNRTQIPRARLKIAEIRLIFDRTAHTLMRSAVAVHFEGTFAPYVRAAFHHMWEEPKKMDDSSTPPFAEGCEGGPTP